MIPLTGYRVVADPPQRFNDAKGFGFITPDSGGKDLLAHFSTIQDSGFKSVRENQKVSFDVTTGPKGEPAVNITPLSRIDSV